MSLYNFDGVIDSDYTWQDFGRDLIVSEDLDPIYVMLWESFIDHRTMCRWLLSYWCYYHAGVSSMAAEKSDADFYNFLRSGLGGDNKFPRGMERRHFWGGMAAKAIDDIESRGSPQAVVDWIASGETFNEVYKRVNSIHGFGPWIGWKVSDMVETCLAEPVDFEDAPPGTILGIYADPVKGAALIRYGDWRSDITKEEVGDIVDAICSEFKDLSAPPRYNRRVNIQEAETVLCKFKAHHKGFYPMGNDTYHVRQALSGWGDLAQQMLLTCPNIKPGHKGYDSMEYSDSPVSCAFA